jgi:hypothetical protein
MNTLFIISPHPLQLDRETWPQTRKRRHMHELLLVTVKFPGFRVFLLFQPLLTSAIRNPIGRIETTCKAAAQPEYREFMSLIRRKVLYLNRQ